MHSGDLFGNTLQTNSSNSDQIGTSLQWLTKQFNYLLNKIFFFKNKLHDDNTKTANHLLVAKY